ncbi:MAG: hypothetical protein H6Q75_1233, partial [Firmicutes bacterium]|nr:hypothetical protein [Bacillota bacterium]
KKRFPIAPGLHEMYIKEDRGLFCSPKVSFILRDFAKFSCRPQIGFFGALFGKIGFYLLFKRRKFIVLKDE